MTVIVGLVENGNVYIGGDSAGIAGLSISLRADEKVFGNGPFIIGGTSSFRMLQLLRYKFSPPAQTVHQEDYEYMVTSFIDSVRMCFASNGFGDKDATMGGTFLVGYKGNLYTIQGDHQVGRGLAPYDAVGCGSDLALGAMYATEGMPPEERINVALRAAATFSAGVSAPFNIIKLETEKQPAKKTMPIKKINPAKKKSVKKTK